jgi:hypothetical protein
MLINRIATGISLGLALTCATGLDYEPITQPIEESQKSLKRRAQIKNCKHFHCVLQFAVTGYR